jgi:hypothetical protein
MRTNIYKIPILFNWLYCFNEQKKQINIKNQHVTIMYIMLNNSVVADSCS